MLWLIIRLKEWGLELIVKIGFQINKLQQVYLGKQVCLDRYVTIYLNKISDKVPTAKIEDNVLIGAYSSIGCSNEIFIEEKVMLVPHIHITDRNHPYEDVKTLISK